ncbi:MAG: hypothetical protein M3478_06190 [Planctomycetota bacterium]|nr:hypothetical protein [Planctomycetota bacterium]
MTQVDVTAPLQPAPEPAPIAPQARGSRIASWAEQLIPRAAGLVYLYAGVMKAWDPTKTHRVFAFDGVPQSLVAPLTHLVWSAEVALALILLIGIAKRRAVIATILVLFVYSVQLAYLIAAQNPPDCSCVLLHAKYASAKQALALGLVRNAVMAASLEWVRLRMAGRDLPART